MIYDELLSRRRFMQTSAAVGAVAAGWNPQVCCADDPAPAQICAFIKPFKLLAFEELADRFAEAGFDALEVPVRSGGLIEPERAVDDLPRLAEILSTRGLTVAIVTSGIRSLRDPHAASVLTTAASLGIPYYRMAYLEYEPNRNVIEQLESFRPALSELVNYSREVGITPLYQNHCGPTLVGAPIWDIWHLVKECGPGEIGVAFDLGHATIEGGESWPIQFNLLEKYIAAHYVKDFVWSGRDVQWVSLGQGRIDGSFFGRLRETFHGPISIHVEYLDEATTTTDEWIEAFKRDLVQLKTWLEA